MYYIFTFGLTGTGKLALGPSWHPPQSHRTSEGKTGSLAFELTSAWKGSGTPSSPPRTFTKAHLLDLRELVTLELFV